MSACCVAPPDLKSPRRAPGDCADPNATRQAGEWLRIGIAAMVAVLGMTFGLAVNISPPGPGERPWIHGVLALSAVIVFALVGGPLCRRSWRELRAGRIVVEQLFLVGILGAFGASVHSSLTGHGAIYYEIVAILLAIYNFGSVIGDRRRALVQRAADSLREQFDQCARLAPGGGEERVPVSSILIGERVLVRPGEGVPIDGRVQAGTGFVREASITGEPFPVVKRPGDSVLAGGHVLDQALTLEATAPGGERQLDHLLDAVRAAQLHPSVVQYEADRLVAWFLPAVLVIAVATGLGWTLAAGWITGLFNALAVLLVACPCALGLATPIGLWGALGQLAQGGVMASSGELIERLARVDTVVFDKTGTLSDDDMTLVDFVSNESGGLERATLKSWVARLQNASAHPVARAFHSWQEDSTAEPPAIDLLPGVGIASRVQDGAAVRLIEIGNRGLLGAVEDHANAAALESQFAPGSLERATLQLFIKVDGRVVGAAVLREQLRESAANALRDLRAAGIDLHVMTGDRADHVNALGLATLPSENVHAGMTPIDKVSLVEKMQAAGRNVLFVGDGLNDSAALARADAGLALASGASLSLEAAAGRLMNGDLAAVPASIAICRATMRAVRANMLFAAGYNLIGITLAASGVLHPVVAALLMLASSITVTTRALRATNRLPAPGDLNAPVSGGLLESFRGQLDFVRNWRAVAAGCSLLALGVFLAAHGHAGAAGWIGFLALFGVAGFLLARWLARPVAGGFTGDRFDEAYRWRGLAEMFAFGTLGMMLGWWADVDFGPIIRDGVCLGCCTRSGAGLGLSQFLNWMNFGMLLGALPMWPGRADWRALGHFFAMLAGMFGAMLAAEQFLARLVVLDPVRHFYFAVAALGVAMSLGMLLACETWRKIFAPPRTAANGVVDAVEAQLQS